MLALPQEAKLLEQFRPAFTCPTYRRFLVLCVGAIIAMGRRSVSRILWAVGPLIQGDPSSYHRFFCQARWSLWPLARILAGRVLARVPANRPVMVAVDDSVDRHSGKKVFAKGCYRDPVRSSHSRTVLTFGHKWVVMAILVKLPFCKRPWALPVLAALYQPPTKNQTAPKAARPRAGKSPKTRKSKAGKKARKPCSKPWSKIKEGRALRHVKDGPRHKTPPLLARQMIATLIHWFPDRHFVLLGDWGFGCHDLALFCYRHRKHVTLIARMRGDTSLYALPPAKKRPGRGRRALKGRRLPSPAQQVAATLQRVCSKVAWYGNRKRELHLLSGCGGWYRGRGGGRAALVPIRWVFVHDPQSGRDDWFFSTDPTLRPQRIVESFAGRWAIEVTFQEMRAHLGLGSTRQWCRQSVLRTVPCLLGLFTVVSLIWAELAKAGKPPVHRTPCYAKAHPTFADALYGVRRLLWEQVILPQCDPQGHVTQLPQALRQILLEHLATAA